MTSNDASNAAKIQSFLQTDQQHACYKKVKKFIEHSPESTTGLVYSRLILSLEAEENFHIKELYKLNAHDFELALELMKDWRIDRFTLAKPKHLIWLLTPQT